MHNSSSLESVSVIQNNLFPLNIKKTSSFVSLETMLFPCLGNTAIANVKFPRAFTMTMILPSWYSNVPRNPLGRLCTFLFHIK